MKEKINNLPYIGTKERYDKWEKESIPVINIIKILEKEHGFKLPEPLQHIESNEVTPKQAVDIDNQALCNPNCPSVVFGRPHAGEFIPEFLLKRIDKEALKSFTVIDRGTNNIFKSEQIPSVGTKISRFIVDPNRAPLLEMDSAKAVVPGKVLWYKGVFDENIYKQGQEPTKEEVEDLVERLYLPYYNGMMSTIGSLTDRRKNKNERTLVIDGHSFPISETFRSYYKKYGLEDIDLPLFVLGDADGEACDFDIRKAFTVALEKNFNALNQEKQQCLIKNMKGGIVGINKPFKGVHNVQFYGQKKEGVNSFQLECNENAYIDEKNGDYYNASYNKENIAIIQKLLEKTCIDIDSVLKGKSNN